MSPQDPPPGPTGPWQAELAVLLPRLRAFVRLQMSPWLRARESIADLVQTTCRELAEHVQELRLRGDDDLRAWLFQVARNKVRERARFHRAGRRDVGREAEDSDAAADLAFAHACITSPSEAAIGEETVQRLQQALDALPDDYREAILLARVAGMSRKEVATAMERSEGAVKMLLSRGLVELLAKLEGRGS